MKSKIPYGRQDIDEADVEAVVDILRSDFLTQGPAVPRFEVIVAQYCGAKHAVATNSATSALHVSCMALDVGPGDWVWTSPTTFVASANCALYCGARVDFVDIDPLTGNMSIDRLTDKLAEAKRRGILPKVVIPVHLCGQSCDMASVHKLAQEYGFRIIEDASHGIGGRFRGEPVGACRYSDITVFSFHPVKIVTTGEGGMALTNDPILLDRLQRHRSHGITSDHSHMLPRPADEIWNYQQIYLGYNYRMTDIQAALGVSQMSRLDTFVERRREIAAHYDEAFASMPVLTLRQNPESWSSYHLYPIRVRESLCGRTQRQVYDALWRAKIAVNLHYIPVYRQPYYEAMGFKAGYCPQAELYHRETISLPMYPGLSEENQAYVINALRTALEK
ncbi:MAG: UDP-4-amino-4,6-dideoxy-N-acetyl-beta-L-altrosamine transaminase [Sedimenticola thiotaurini]|uniref:UDP-4-amino-4, 6-dideoxy-N-acetyl-beta-L-altrosamine transaminase n=1 Tax=Sedimenticola thiotaurini TaxID=1543721 RepID=A0A558DAP3_9GAMM|nr:MAG: UDP-4-amino-4,6-dideoxy-N-acetyl-beta-L-altrosamine transaminase [Sedimenticola thiotaurini]